MIVGGYSLDLYCDALGSDRWNGPPHGWNEFPHQFTGQTYAECARAARERGWRLTRDDKAICPRCNRKRQKTTS